MLHFGSPGSTALRVFIPQSLIGIFNVIIVPANISTTAIGNFGINFFETNNITRAITPIITDGIFACFKVSYICSASSKNSPVPELPPIIFGICINIIVVHIPVINPPITGAEI